MKRLDASAADFDAQLDALLDFSIREDSKVVQVVAEIVADVRQRGDTALVELTERLDGHAVENGAALEIGQHELQQAYDSLPSEHARALRVAHDRVRDYHDRQQTDDLTYTDALGNRLGQRWTPVDRAGVYVPGGQASYPSSVLMTVVPARCADVGEVILVVPTPGGERHMGVLAAAHIAGVDRVFTVGGAQAIAALAYGTETIPAVDKIVGPGNAYVAAAKRQVFGQVGIDSIAGPSEVLVIADDSAAPDWVALDLFSQAEHDPVAQSIVVSTSAQVLDAISGEMERLLPMQPRREIIEASLQGRGGMILVHDLAQAAEVANRIAAEHVELMVREPEPLAAEIRHAGALFLGAASAEVLGDYVAGPSHVLPTYGTARFSSPLSVYDFRKRSSLIQLSAAGAAEIAGAAQTLAEMEGLHAHAGAAALRRSDAPD